MLPFDFMLSFEQLLKKKKKVKFWTYIYIYIYEKVKTNVWEFHSISDSVFSC